MVRPLRRAHHAIWWILALLLPAILVLGVTSRHQPRDNALRWETFR